MAQLAAGQDRLGLRGRSEAAMHRLDRLAPQSVGRSTRPHASLAPKAGLAAPPRSSTHPQGSAMSDNRTPRPPSPSDPQTGTSGNGAGSKGAASTGGTDPGSLFTAPAPGGTDKTVATVMGEIVWLFSQSARHKSFFISDLEWLVMTPVLLKQFRLFYAPDRPIGVALWAFASEAVAARLAAGNARLAPGDWKSGDTLWLVDIVAPFGGHDEMLKDLKQTVFPQREVKYLGVEEGERLVRTI